ncbi:hypothetical protein [Rathayibacter sp. AY1F9]|uniref:hypothetical protein n=1 Tax=Rathayibacter sp. AY1F9 TaxID=2080563 RepID=UPI000CE7BD33|nr:hypothetical protein [Rathayibacter sp. AY1F9]PPH27811.1 hypothetical protein C5C37_12335 [Rathayibacter sp. AY1F9]
MSSIAVDVRHAAGAVFVRPKAFLDRPAVHLAFPELEVPLSPAEAWRLATALLEAAHRSEHPVVNYWLDDPDAEEAASRTDD